MTQITPQSAKEIFLIARELRDRERDAYLSDACGASPQLLRRVRALLHAETAIGTEALAPAPSVSPITDELNRYELLDILGEGGFGTVYRARRRHGIQGEVALKVLRAGMDSQEALQRFQAEQQALEAMDHPGIARVLDAGLTKAGRPYLVMEIVRGEPITRFAEREQLTVAQRVALIADVCRAVQHAHYKGVVHRDLKPSNILAWRSFAGGGSGATDQCFSKVIDFGVAKAMQGSPLVLHGMTRTTQFIGTPAYMSPEQARGNAASVDARADIYSLGAVLYELLCSRPVLDETSLADASPADIERAVCDTIPLPPSQRISRSPQQPPRLARLLQGELDWIVMRALEKDPARRYATADAIAADLERFLRGETIDAAPPSRWYAFKRLVRRHQAACIAALVVTLSLIGATLWSTVESARAKKAEATAIEQRAAAEAISTFLGTDLISSMGVRVEEGDDKAKEMTMRDVLAEAGKRIEEASRPGGSLTNQPLVRAHLLVTLSETYGTLSDFESQRQYAEATLASLKPAGVTDHDIAIRALRCLGNAKEQQVRYADALKALEDSLAMSQRLYGSEHLETAKSEIAYALFRYNRNGRKDPPLEDDNLRRVENIIRHARIVLMRDAKNAPKEVLVSSYLLGATLVAQQRFTEAEPLLRETIEYGERTLGKRQPNVLLAKQVLATCLRQQSRNDESYSVLRELIDDRLFVFGERHRHTLMAMQSYTDRRVQDHDYQKALEFSLRSYEGWKSLAGENHPATLHCQSVYGEILTRLGDFEHGVPMLQDSFDRMMQHHGETMDDANWIGWRLVVAKRAQAQGSWEGVE